MNLDIRKREISYRNLPIILRRHQLWLEDSSKGEKADFSNTYLVGVCFRAEDLRGVNFQGAYLKYGIIKFKVDLKRLWRQTPYLLAKNITCQRLKVFLSGFLFVYLLKKQEVAFLNILKPHMIYPFQIWYVKC